MLTKFIWKTLLEDEYFIEGSGAYALACGLSIFTILIDIIGLPCEILGFIIGKIRRNKRR